MIYNPLDDLPDYAEMIKNMAILAPNKYFRDEARRHKYLAAMENLFRDSLKRGANLKSIYEQMKKIDTYGIE